MTYEEALNYIHTRNKFNQKAGLENITALLQMLGNPHRELQFIHVAGTNGKGSTTTMISNVLQETGLKVGKFISPFIIEFGERMQINGEMISHEELVEIVTYVKSFADILDKEGRGPVEFELVTVIGFLFFHRHHCDIVVLEVGLGGRYDSTNVISAPLVSVIATIGYDHMAIIGNTLTAIAREKSGIIKLGSVTVTYPKQAEEALTVIEATAKEKGNDLIIGDLSSLQIIKQDLFGNNFTYKGIDFHLPLSGEHQVYNCMTALETLFVLRDRYGFAITTKDLQQGIAKSSFPARMEVLHRNPLVVADGAHNAEGIEALIHNFSLLHNKRVFLMIGMLADKHFAKGLYALCRLPYKVYTVTPPSPRQMSGEELAEKLGEHGITATPIPNLEEAYMEIKAEMSPEDVLVICGSLYLASAVRPTILADK